MSSKMKPSKRAYYIRGKIKQGKATSEEKAWLDKYEGKAPPPPDIVTPSGNAPTTPPVQSPISGAANPLPPLNLDMPASVDGKKPDAKKPKVEVKRDENGHIVPTPVGTAAAKMYEEYVRGQNAWLLENGGRAYPEGLIGISVFSVQQLADYYVTPLLGTEMALHALNAATPIAWVAWFKFKHKNALDEKMAEAEKLEMKARETSKAGSKPIVAAVPPSIQNEKEVKAAVEGIAGGNARGGSLV